MYSQNTVALQKHYLQKCEDFFWILLRLGCIPQSQICRLLFKNATDSTTNTALMQTFEGIGLINRVQFGNTNICRATHTVSRYFGNKQIVKISGAKLKRGSLILEKYLRLGYYDRPTKNLRERLDKTTALLYLPTASQSIKLLKRYQTYFEERNLHTDGIQNELAVLQKRYDFQFDKKIKIDSNVTDLYHLESINCFLSGIRFELKNGKFKPIINADIYNIHNLPSQRLAKHILTSMTTLESIFNIDINMGIVVITIYSHEEQNTKEMNIVYNYLSYKLGLDIEPLKNQVKFIYFGTKAHLFSHIDPSNII